MKENAKENWCSKMMGLHEPPEQFECILPGDVFFIWCFDDDSGEHIGP